ncbi:MAG TPA: copper amine oxidase N-terminal domain-containing protein [Candidatus Limnocylindria bacterium]|nr:copper amine oxidase N-terminal domain-containing protein [Candidatus Limnocylindria bacterium]
MTSPSTMIAVLATAVFPVLFNDRHVDLRPEGVASGRVLVALAQGDTLYVPLHAMLAELGATVSYDPATRTATFERSGTSLTVTVGVAQVAIDGQTRPLDVAPIERDGTVLVPLRVIAEAMGAYVAYLPLRHVVEVRYAPTVALQQTMPPVALSPEPVPLATRPTVPPGPPIPVEPPDPESYVEAAAAFDHGTSISGRAASEFSVLDVPLLAEAAYASAPADDFDVHLGVQLSPQKIYADAGYGSFSTSYGATRVGGVGFGVEKLPLLENKVSYGGSVMYYPHMSGVCSSLDCPTGLESIAYGVLTYRAGVTYSAGHAFLEAGYRGAHGYRKAGPPGDLVRHGAYAGVGVRL